MLGDDLIEALLQSQELGLDASQEAPVNIEPHILLFGVLSDRDALSIGLKLMLDYLSIGIVFYTEGVVQHTCDVVVPEERQVFEGFCALLVQKKHFSPQKT